MTPKPCAYRLATIRGTTCTIIPDSPQVDPDICGTCPVTVANCMDLRALLKIVELDGRDEAVLQDAWCGINMQRRVTTACAACGDREAM